MATDIITCSSAGYKSKVNPHHIVHCNTVSTTANNETEKESDPDPESIASNVYFKENCGSIEISSCQNLIVPVNPIESNHNLALENNSVQRNEQVQIISATDTDTVDENKIINVATSDSAIYVLVADESSIDNTSQASSVGIVSDTDTDSLKSIDPNSTTQTVQIMNSEGVPVHINVNDLLSSISDSKTNNDTSQSSILNLTSSLLSTSHGFIQGRHNVHQAQQYEIRNVSPLELSNVPSWALNLRDSMLYGDTYTGYVFNENEMDIVINMYKKETQSIFAIRQTPSPAKDESLETVRLMWKSQYVPYDGIPFVNVGRRATVMECEYGPRKRSNAIKRMIQMHGHKNTMKKIPNLTCPARLFVKKVRKFPQFRVPTDADPKFLRQLQEQSLKLVRNAGFNTGEVRLYLQLPLPSAHRYHHIGNSIDAFERELEEHGDVMLEEIAVDSRVLLKIQELVRQGYVNPFIVRAAMKDYVENKLELNEHEERPYKHNKIFYPPMIEIQNIIQQTQAAMSAGVVAPLPAPSIPPVTPRSKRKRTPSLPSTPLPNIKKVKMDSKAKASRKSRPSKYDLPTSSPTIFTNASSSKEELPSETPSSVPVDQETISLTLTDNQLENFSVNNFSYDQLQQLAKIGLLALNNASKDTSSIQVVTEEMHTGPPVCDDLNAVDNKTAGDCNIKSEVLDVVSSDLTLQNILPPCND